MGKVSGELLHSGELTSSGHITVRDPILRDHFWMNPFGVHFSSMTVSKLVLVTPEGFVHPTLGAQRPINVSCSYSPLGSCGSG